MFRMALHVSQASPEATAYVDDRMMYVEVAGSMGIRGIHHVDLETTRAKLAEMGVAAATG